MRAGCLLLLASMGHAHAQNDPSTQRRYMIEPRLQLSEIYTDNYSASSTQAESDLISRLTAGVGWRARVGAIRGNLDYALTAVAYARHSDRNELQNALNADLAADLIDNRLQLLTSASIARAAISAFGVQPGGGGDASANVTETRNLQVTPTLRGPVGPELSYTAALSQSYSSAASSSVGDSRSTSVFARLEPTTRARLGWALDASHLTSTYEQGRSTRTDRLFGSLNWAIDDLDLRLSAKGGTERTNLLSLDSTRYSTWGVGAVWTPSPLTRVSADIEERFFGLSHALSIEHRTARTIFRLRSARSLSTSGSSNAGQDSTLFDLYNGQPGWVARFPDAAVREAAVNDFIRRGLNEDPLRVVNSGFLRSAATVDDDLSLSAAWTGPRSAAMLTLSRSKARRADTLTTAFDDLSLVNEVRTRRLSVDLSHRLTPLSTLTLLLAQQRGNAGDGTTALANRQTQVDLQYSTRLNQDTTLSGGLRRTQFQTGLRSYAETALSANLGMRF